MSVYKVKVWEKFVFEVEAENKSEATKKAFSKTLSSNKNKNLSHFQTNIGKPEWLRKSEKNEDE